MFRKKFFLNLKKNKFELNTFFFGIFLLPSIPSISLILLLLTCVSLSFKKKSYLKDAYNWSLILSSLLILISSISNTFFPNQFYKDYYNIDQIWIGIANWLPYFWIFWLFQRFSYNQIKRRNIIIVFLAGSIPVIISGLLQYFLKIHGPFVFFNGLVTWYSREILPGDGMTGLFNNTNYFGMWLNIIWPFALALTKENFSKGNIKFVGIVFSISILICTILTFSRNAWLGLVLSTMLVLGIKSLKWLIPLLSLLITPVLIGLGYFFNNFLTDIAQKFIPQIIFQQFRNSGFENFSSFTRVQIWDSSLNFVFQKPLTGWGSSSFPVLFKIDNGADFFAHSHNLPLEIALSFGIPTAILITSTIVSILYFSQKIIFKSFLRKPLLPYDRAWWSSAVTIFVCHMFDVQYFDVRIGLTLWILLGGLRNIIRNDVITN